MLKDKSETHVRVIKNGHEGWITKQIWEHMESSGDKNGFEAIATTPPEVEAMKRKLPQETEINNDSFLDASSDFQPEQLERKKPGPKPKIQE